MHSNRTKTYEILFKRSIPVVVGTDVVSNDVVVDISIFVDADISFDFFGSISTRRVVINIIMIIIILAISTYLNLSLWLLNHLND